MNIFLSQALAVAGSLTSLPLLCQSTKSNLTASVLYLDFSDQLCLMQTIQLKYA